MIFLTPRPPIPPAVIFYQQEEHFMRIKFFTIFICILLAGCTETNIFPYEGSQKINGEGGFLDYRYIIDEETQVENGYKYNQVSIYLSGLPLDKSCELIGLITSSSMEEIVNTTLELEGNTLTQSGVSFPLSFENKSGILENSVKPISEIIHTGNFHLPIHRYNAFECK